MALPEDIKLRREPRINHGMSQTVEYQTWTNIRARCYSPNDSKYSSYGGRGITVCDRWLNGFLNFHEDMGPRPSDNHTIARINNDGPYSPENCKWLPREQNRREKREKPQKPRTHWDEMRELRDKGYARCYACSQNLPVGDFHRDRSSRRGIGNRCKSCAIAYQHKIRAMKPNLAFTEQLPNGFVLNTSETLSDQMNNVQKTDELPTTERNKKG